MEQIPIKSFKVPDVENDSVSLRDRSVVQGSWLDHAEKSVAPPAGVNDSFQQERPNRVSLGS
jgi:hypothetical protein